MQPCRQFALVKRDVSQLTLIVVTVQQHTPLRAKTAVMAEEDGFAGAISVEVDAGF